MPDDTPSTLSTLGACPTCGRERLLRVEMEPMQGGGIGFRTVHYVDCGKCPTLKVEALAPGDEPAHD